MEPLFNFKMKLEKHQVLPIKFPSIVAVPHSMGKTSPRIKPTQLSDLSGAFSESFSAKEKT